MVGQVFIILDYSSIRLFDIVSRQSGSIIRTSDWSRRSVKDGLLHRAFKHLSADPIVGSLPCTLPPWLVIQDMNGVIANDAVSSDEAYSSGIV